MITLPGEDWGVTFPLAGPGSVSRPSWPAEAGLCEASSRGREWLKSVGRAPSTQKVVGLLWFFSVLKFLPWIQTWVVCIVAGHGISLYVADPGCNHDPCSASFWRTLLPPPVGSRMPSQTWKACCNGGSMSLLPSSSVQRPWWPETRQLGMWTPQDTARLRLLGGKWLLRARAAWRGGNLFQVEKAILVEEIRAQKATFVAISWEGILEIKGLIFFLCISS